MANTPVSGRIRDFGLVELLQTLSLVRKSARIDVAQDAVSTGVLLVDRGRVVHAATPALRGEEAFFEIGEWTDGTFTLTPDVVVSPTDRTIESSNDWLILELLRRRDAEG